MTTLLTFFLGVLFAVGLALSGMTDPLKVQGFLDIFGDWNAQLLFVMIGATGFHIITYPLIRKRQSPLLSPDWHIPTKREITPQLIVGALLFGTGWGLAGYCPGPALVAATSLEKDPLIFVTAMLVGMILYSAVESKVRWNK